MGESSDTAEDTDGKPMGNKNGKKGEGLMGSSFFTWFMIITLLGVWTSVAVVWFDLVDYEDVLARAKDFHYNISEVLQAPPPPRNDFGKKFRDVLKEHLRLVKEKVEAKKKVKLNLAKIEIEKKAKAEKAEKKEAVKAEKSRKEAAVKKEKAKTKEKAGTEKANLKVKDKTREKDKIQEKKNEKEEKPSSKNSKDTNKFDKSSKDVNKKPNTNTKDAKPQEEDAAGVPEPDQMEIKEKKKTKEKGKGGRRNEGLRRSCQQISRESQSQIWESAGRLRGALVTLEKLVQLFPDDVSLKNDLGVGYLLLGDNEHAKRVYEEVLSVAPDDGFAKVHYGFILKSENMMAESIPYLKEGLESGDPGTDDGRFYFHLGDALQRVGDKDAYKWYEIGHQRGHFASVWQRSLYNVDRLKAQAWWTAKETGYTDLVKALERNWKTIRDEALGVMDTERGLFIPEDENLREKGEWGQFTLWQQGKKNENSCRGVPKTCALLERFSEATGCKRGQIKYSVMQPGTHIWPHTGPTNCRLRMHLGLVIPSEGCRIRCANDTRSWEEGKVLIFDDSFEHEVWQDADSYRLIFIVDVWHPELTPHQRRTLSPI
ncbi:UNVERIFIED_CONTAM: hypothetical protein FKN15_002255 [Acipenser sinensis]